MDSPEGSGGNNRSSNRINDSSPMPPADDRAPAPLNYARNDAAVVSPFASNVRMLAVIDLCIITISALDAGLRIPGDYYPLGGIGFDRVGAIAVLVGIPIAVLCLFTKVLHIKLLALIFIVEAIVWYLCLVKNMYYL